MACQQSSETGHSMLRLHWNAKENLIAVEMNLKAIEVALNSSENQKRKEQERLMQAAWRHPVSNLASESRLHSATEIVIVVVMEMSARLTSSLSLRSSC